MKALEGFVQRKCMYTGHLSTVAGAGGLESRPIWGRRPIIDTVLSFDLIYSGVEPALDI